jgi:hypothetical protein
LDGNVVEIGFGIVAINVLISFLPPLLHQLRRREPPIPVTLGGRGMRGIIFIDVRVERRETASGGGAG